MGNPKEPDPGPAPDQPRFTIEISTQSLELSRLVRRYIIGTFVLFGLVLISFSIVKILERINDYRKYSRNLEGITRLGIALRQPVSFSENFNPAESPSRLIEHWGLLGSEESAVFQVIELARTLREKGDQKNSPSAEIDREFEHRRKMFDLLLASRDDPYPARIVLVQLQTLLQKTSDPELVITAALKTAKVLVESEIEKNWVRLFWELFFRVLPFGVCSAACYSAFKKMAKKYSEFADNITKRETLLIRKDQSKGLILDSLSEGILEYELETETWITISKRFVKLLEETTDGALTHRLVVDGIDAWYKCIHPKDRTEIMGAMRSLISEGKAFKKTIRFLTELGNLRTFEITAVARISDTENFRSDILAISHRDVSAERSAEIQKNLLMSMIGRSPDLYLIYDSRGVPLFVSPAGKAIGLENTSERFSNVFRPLDPSLKAEQIFDLVKKQTIWRGEVSLKGTDTAKGKLFFQTVFPVQGDQEGSTNFAVVAQDVTERFQHREALEMVRERMNLALDSGKMGVWDWNLVTRTLDWDNHVRDIFDFSNEGAPSFEVFKERIHPEDLPKVQQEIETSITSKTIFSSRFRVTRKNGDIRTIRATGEVKYDSHGNPLRMVGLNWDAAKEVEDENALIVSRHAQLNNARLASIGEMAGGIAHEINNPLGVITAKAFLMRDSLRKLISADAFEKFENDLSTIESNGFRISKIVKGLRNLSREDPAGFVFYPTPVKDFLEDGLVFCRERFRTNGVELIAEYDGVLDLAVECNSTQISQVILNLLNNAHDAAIEFPKPCVTIHSWKDDVNFHVVVSDSGTGVPKEIEAKIMEPFFTTKPTGKGTGLGLSISHSIANLHGGRLFLDRSISSSAFHLEIPIWQRKEKKSA